MNAAGRNKMKFLRENSKLLIRITHFAFALEKFKFSPAAFYAFIFSYAIKPILKMKKRKKIYMYITIKVA